MALENSFVLSDDHYSVPFYPLQYTYNSDNLLSFYCSQVHPMTLYLWKLPFDHNDFLDLKKRFGDPWKLIPRGYCERK